MTSTKITQLTATQNLGVDDLLVAVDVSDTSMSPTGTNKKIKPGGLIHKVTPFMFGAVGDSETDDTVAVQAFFDHAQDEENARKYIYDFSGRWFVTDTIYANYPPIDEVQRTFICGNLLFPAASEMDGGVTVEWGMFISGSRNVWKGQLSVTCDTEGAYTTRPYQVGVAMASVAATQFDYISVTRSKRDAVLSINSNSTFTVRSGNEYERTYDTNNSIALEIGMIDARYFGSTEKSPSISSSTTLTSYTNGNVNPPPFNAVTGGFAGSPFQGCQLVVGSTAQMRVDDRIKLAHLLTSTQFGTVSFNNGTRKITRTSGSWVDDGLEVGNRYAVLSGDGAGEYEVTAVAATELTVWPAPPTVAAYAPTGIISRWLYYPISSIQDATTVTVIGWIPTRITAATCSPVWLSTGFAFKTLGGDTANQKLGTVIGFVGGGAICAGGLYGCRVGTMLAEYVDIGLQTGAYGYSSVDLGTSLSHYHAENVDFDIFQVSPGSLQVSGASSYDLSKIQPDGRRFYVTALEPDPVYGLLYTTIRIGGLNIYCGDLPHQNVAMDSFYFSDGNFSNSPTKRDRTLVGDTATVVISYDAESDRIGSDCNWARLRWMRNTGAAPTGTLTLSLSAELAAKGWTLVGGGDMTTTDLVEFAITYLFSYQKVVVQVVGGEVTYVP